MTIFHALKLFVKSIIHNSFCEYIYGMFNKGTIQIDERKGKQIFFLMTPDYGNVGDQAIAYASIQFLEENFQEYQIVEIPINLTCRYLYAIKKIIKEQDIVFLQGGGNMGNMYRDIDNIRNFVLKILRRNKIISFPLTVFFSNDFKGKYTLRKNIKIYSKCRDLTLIAREKTSYNFLINNFMNCKVLLCPDMVFYLHPYEVDDKKRNSILINLRQDAEGVLGEKGKQICKEVFWDFEEAYLFDTTVNRKVDKIRRTIEVESILREMRLAKIIITDRMHGMIFAALTGTPCIVFEAKDHKIRGSYAWIQELNYIKLLSNNIDIKDMMHEIIELVKQNTVKKDTPNLGQEFKELKNNLL